MLMKMKQRGKRLLAILLVALIGFGIVAVNTDTISLNAADGTLIFNGGDIIEYGDHFTRGMTFDGNNIAYCAEPLEFPPEPGEYEYDLLSKSSIIRKALFYLPGGYGYADTIKETCLDGWSANNCYVIGHLVVSYLFSENEDEAFYGASDSYVEKSIEVIETIEALPAPPDNFRAFRLPGDDQQTIVGSWYEMPYGWIELQKSTANGAISDGNANYSLQGAQYGIYLEGTLVETLTTNQSGYAKSGLLEADQTYQVREISASPGYAVDVASYNVSVRKDETGSVTVSEVPQNNPMDLLLQKLDMETGLTEPQGAASFTGAEFTVKYYDIQSDQDPAIGGAVPLRQWVFRTDEEGKINFNEQYLVSGDPFCYQTDGSTICVPLGTLTVQETKAPEGYHLNNTVFVTKITGDGNQESVLVYQEAEVEEQPYRGDLELIKIADGDAKRMAGVPFKITSLTTGENHTIVTDVNGYASTASSWNRHSNNTNQGTSAEDGIWFGAGPVDDSKGALLYDTYRLEEQRCKANEGMDLLTIEIKIYKDSVSVDLGTLTDDYIEIGTSAVDQETDSHLSNADEKVTIVDTVTYKGLKKGVSYKVTGTLMDKETAEPILVDGKPVTAETEFEAKSTSGTVDVTFTFNGVSLAGKTTVVFEELYLENEKLAVHADIEDADQTIYHPAIGTTAKDSETNIGMANADKEVTLVDTVAYQNLIPGEEYELQGTLMDKETGKEVLVDGKPVISAAKFTPTEASGTVDVTFIFGGSSLAGTTTVVFETLLYNSKEIATHADISDAGQTVIFPEIKTTAEDTDTGGHNAVADEEVTITDEVLYTNLIPGKEYHLTGTLMIKGTGKPLMIGTKPVTAETSFTPDEADGSVSLTFTFDGSALKGQVLVAFESLTLEGIEVAFHTDLEDEDQSIYFPTIRTTAKDQEDDDQEAFADTSVTIVDTVTYTNLVPGNHYKLTGVLMDKATNQAVSINGRQVTAETEFVAETAAGSEEVTFTFNASALVGHEMVVFEKLYLVNDTLETELTNHEDITDRGQTVKLVRPVEPKEPSDKGFGNGSTVGRTPKTGDYSSVKFYILLLGTCSLILLVGAYVEVKRKKSSN